MLIKLKNILQDVNPLDGCHAVTPDVPVPNHKWLKLNELCEPGAGKSYFFEPSSVAQPSVHFPTELAPAALGETCHRILVELLECGLHAGKDVFSSSTYLSAFWIGYAMGGDNADVSCLYAMPL